MVLVLVSPGPRPPLAGTGRLHSSPCSLWSRTRETGPEPDGPDRTADVSSEFQNKTQTISIWILWTTDLSCKSCTFSRTDFESLTCSRPVSGELHIWKCLLLSVKGTSTLGSCLCDTWKCSEWTVNASPRRWKVYVARGVEPAGALVT